MRARTRSAGGFHFFSYSCALSSSLLFCPLPSFVRALLSVLPGSLRAWANLRQRLLVTGGAANGRRSRSQGCKWASASVDSGVCAGAGGRSWMGAGAFLRHATPLNVTGLRSLYLHLWCAFDGGTVARERIVCIYVPPALTRVLVAQDFLCRTAEFNWEGKGVEEG
ncbi:hypothetical protein B0H11DRAFT_1899102 [Mycena galericulata]|nr:hypothetical protein B0H11DRAFT_1899102 [Mycena galericulata]